MRRKVARLRAADSLLDRGGLAGSQKIAVDHTHRDMTGAAIGDTDQRTGRQERDAHDRGYGFA
jgi:hypothetical protein